ncbi:unnamed protein product [Blepharisma stoltei]|uniref:CBM20 domain-containing protein n=1 Tax=Blepharisma stoltei TaxID=1481888 RepID=A0AAU9J1U5_9CILI|nr:unnamed protein product [Blepharisma stoltei]
MKRSSQKHSSFIANFHNKKTVGLHTPKAETIRFFNESPKGSSPLNIKFEKEDQKFQGFHSHRRSNTSQGSPTLKKFNLSLDKSDGTNYLVVKANFSEEEETASQTERILLKQCTPDTLLSEDCEACFHTEGDLIDRDQEKIIDFIDLIDKNEENQEYKADLIENERENGKRSEGDKTNEAVQIFNIFDQLEEEKEIIDDVEEIEEKIEEVGKKNIEPEMVTVYFNIPYETKLGENIVVVGDTEKFGSWDTNKGLKLEWSKGNFWRGNIIIAQEEAKYLEFKYAVNKRNGSKWEMGDNRKLHIQNNLFSCCCQHEFWQITKEKSQKSDIINISFRLLYRAKIGENLRVVGNSEKLGNWDFNKGLKLEWTRGHNWIGRIEIDKLEACNLEFKYVVVQDTYQKWERGSNHKLNFNEESGTNFYLNDLWHA